MPLKTGADMDTTFFGTAADGTQVTDYCKFCYMNGAFVDPALTVADMIARSVGHMTRVLKIPADKAKEMANDVIPKLKRWEKQALP